jgi:hypothetical protein
MRGGAHSPPRSRELPPFCSCSLRHGDFIVGRRIRLHGREDQHLYRISTVLAGQSLGIKEVDAALVAQLYGLRFGLYRSGAKNLQPLDNPFGPRLLPMS